MQAGFPRLDEEAKKEKNSTNSKVKLRNGVLRAA
jgi:hypothetical protein